MKSTSPAVAALCCLVLAACGQPAPPPAPDAVTQAEAEQVFAATVAEWQSMDAARIKAVYAPDFAGFDFGGGLITDRAAWDKAQDGFAAAQFDQIELSARKIQLLGPDAFLVSALGKDISSANPQTSVTFRCTDAFQRAANGKWLVVSEHCSGLPD